MVVLAGVWYVSRDIPDSEYKIVSIWSATGSLLLIVLLPLWLFRPQIKY